MCSLTPDASICYCGLDLDCDGWECSDGDGEDEADGQSHHPDLITEHQTQ